MKLEVCKNFCIRSVKSAISSSLKALLSESIGAWWRCLLNPVASALPTIWVGLSLVTSAGNCCSSCNNRLNNWSYWASEMIGWSSWWYNLLYRLISCWRCLVSSLNSSSLIWALASWLCWLVTQRPLARVNKNFSYASIYTVIVNYTIVKSVIAN